MNYYTDLTTMPDKELIKMYRCTKCPGSNINKSCGMCQKAINELTNRHKDVIDVYAFKLWKEFRTYDGSRDVEDYKEELQFKMLESMNTKIDIDRIDHNYKTNKMFYQTYMSLRINFAGNRNRIYKYGVSECYFDDVMGDATSSRVNNIFQKTVERITGATKEDFTQALCSKLDFNAKLKTLDEAEKFLVEKLLDGWVQKDIAKEMKKSQAYVTGLKRKIAQKIYNIK